MPADLTPQDHADIAALTGEIMHLVDNYCGRYPAALQQDVTDLLTTRITEAGRAYDAQPAAEETHRYGRDEHPISSCRPTVCGRYPGQRRATPRAARMGTGLVNNDDTETLNFADESDYQDRP